MHHRIRRPISPLLLTGTSVFFFAVAGAPAQLRVVNFNVAQLGGNQAALGRVLAAVSADDKTGFATAPGIYVFQEVRSANVVPLLSLLNNNAPPGVVYTQGTYTNSGEDGAAGAQAMFYRADLLAEDAAAHVDIFTGGGRNTDRWKLSLVGYGSSDAAFYIYSSHLKASQGSSNEQQRLSGATAIRNNADSLPFGTHIIYAGDYNVYSNAEPAYQKMISAGIAQAVDPLGTGSWAGAGNAIKHSQAPCRNGCTLVGGGMDDRFDLQLSTAAWHDGEGLAIIPGTYRSLGNDGNHFDTDINAGNNTYYPADIPRSNALADDLHIGSDHVPVVADYQIPAVLAAALPADFGRVIQGAVFSVDLAVSNAADVLVAAGADELDYDVTASGDLSGASAGSVAALAPAAAVPLVVNTANVGPALGTVNVTSGSEAVEGAPLLLQTAGQIVRASNASFSEQMDENQQTVSATLPADSGVQPISVALFNFGFDADQALLDVDGIDGLAPPFALVGGLPTGIGAAPGDLAFSFDTTGLAPGLYAAALTVNVSDEDLPGETQTALTLHLQVLVPSDSADVDCDGDVDGDDVTAFVGVLLATNGDPCSVDRSDFDGSASPDGRDIPWFITAFLSP